MSKFVCFDPGFLPLDKIKDIIEIDFEKRLIFFRTDDGGSNNATKFGLAECPYDVLVGKGEGGQGPRFLYKSGSAEFRITHPHKEKLKKMDKISKEEARLLLETQKKVCELDDHFLRESKKGRATK